MDLFENDIINITNIYNVTKYITPKEAVNESQTFQYNSKLATYELVFLSVVKIKFILTALIL